MAVAANAFRLGRPPPAANPMQGRLGKVVREALPRWIWVAGREGVPYRHRWGRWTQPEAACVRFPPLIGVLLYGRKEP